MARNRQRAKERQAARRAKRLDEREEERTELEVGAPPTDLGSSESTLEAEQHEDEAEADIDLEEDYDFEDEEQPHEPEGAGPRGVRGGDEKPEEKAEGRKRGRVLGFLANSWAELQRVEWPNRQQVTTLTGVVLGFVVIAGGYLGALDALFSRIIESII